MSHKVQGGVNKCSVNCCWGNFNWALKCFFSFDNIFFCLFVFAEGCFNRSALLSAVVVVPLKTFATGFLYGKISPCDPPLEQMPASFQLHYFNSSGNGRVVVLMARQMEHSYSCSACATAENIPSALERTRRVTFVVSGGSMALPLSCGVSLRISLIPFVFTAVVLKFGFW